MPRVAAGSLSVSLGSSFRGFVRANPQPRGDYTIAEGIEHVVKLGPQQWVKVVNGKRDRITLISSQTITTRSVFDSELRRLTGQWGAPTLVVSGGDGNALRQAVWERMSHRMYIIEYPHQTGFFTAIVAEDKPVEHWSGGNMYYGL